MGLDRYHDVAFEHWMADHEYRDEYFESPDLLETALPEFFDHLASMSASSSKYHSDPDWVVGLLGAGTFSVSAKR